MANRSVSVGIRDEHQRELTARIFMKTLQIAEGRIIIICGGNKIDLIILIKNLKTMAIAKYPMEVCLSLSEVGK